MRSTLFLIPHDLAGVPLFGWGLLFVGLAVACVSWLVWSLACKRALSEISGALPVWIVAGLIVVFVLPGVELRLADATPIGLPIRGYGVMVLLGLLAGIAISAFRGSQLKIPVDTVIGLGFWMMLGGIVGARLFYVVQKWDDAFAQLPLSEQLVAIVKLTEGGLVIYGGVVGGLLAGAWYCRSHRLKLAATADLIAPGFLIGLAFGRLGCLLHGCCFGGVCTANLPSIQFPEGSLPYYSQLESGKLLGLDLKETHYPPGTVERIAPESPAAAAGMSAGQRVEEIQVTPATLQENPTKTQPLRADVNLDGQRVTFLPEQLPPQSLPVHPSQIYASINALLLCLLIWQLQPLPNRDGVAFLIAILLYAISRFLLEGVRSDEMGQLGTSLTIAQWVSLVSGSVALVGLWAVRWLPAGREWQWPRANSTS